MLLAETESETIQEIDRWPKTYNLGHSRASIHRSDPINPSTSTTLQLGQRKSLFGKLVKSTHTMFDNLGQDTWILDRRLEALNKTNNSDEVVYFLASHVPRHATTKQLYRMLDEYLDRPERWTSESQADETITMLELGVWCILHIPDVAEPLLGILASLYTTKFQQSGNRSDIDRAIECYSKGISLASSSFEGRPRLLNNQGHSYICLFEHSRNLTDLNKAIEAFTLSSSLVSTNHALKSTIFRNLGLAYSTQYRHTNTSSDCSKAIDCFLQSISLLTEGHPGKIDALECLSLSYHARFKRDRQTTDVDSAISGLEQAVSLAPMGDMGESSRFCNLGAVHLSRFRFRGSPDDIQAGINCLDRARVLMSPIHPELRTVLVNLGAAYQIHFQHFGGLEHLQQAIKMLDQALLLYSDEDLDSASCHGNLGVAYDRRFRRLGETVDLELAIHHKVQAILITPDHHEDKPLYLSNLAISYHGRYQRLGDIADLERALERLEIAISLTPEMHPEVAQRLNILACLETDRFGHFGGIQDLELAVKHAKHAVSLTPLQHPSYMIYIANLGIIHLTRFKRHKMMSDMEEAVTYLERVIASPNESLERSVWLDYLGIALVGRFENQGGVEDINRAIELQTQAASLITLEHVDRPVRLNNLGNSHHRRFLHLGKREDLDQGIEYQTLASSLVTEAHKAKPTILLSLSESYTSRFYFLGVLVDVDHAINLTMEAMLLVPEHHPGKPMQLNHLGNVYLRRYERLQNAEDLEKSIKIYEQAIALMPREHPDHSAILNNLSISYGFLFRNRGVLSDISKAIDCCQNGLLLLSPSDSQKRSKLLTTLAAAHSARYEQTNQVLDITKSIISHIDALELTSEEEVNFPFRLHDLSMAFMQRFKRTGNLEDITQAIDYLEDAETLMPEGHELLTSIHNHLAFAYLERSDSFGETKDMARVMSYIQEAALSSQGSPLSRLKASHCWALILLIQNNTSALSAYQNTMKLLPQVLWIGITATQRYQIITTLGAVSISIEAATAAIQYQEYGLALEWLEQGRYVVWNQMLQLRQPLNDLNPFDSQLAERLKEVAYQLDQSSSISTADHRSLLVSPLSLESEAQRHRRLAEEWASLISKVRHSPGMSTFLQPKPLAELVQAAHSSTVVVINVDKKSCAALIILMNAISATHVPLPNFTLAQAVNARTQLMESLHHGHFRDRGLRKVVFQQTVKTEDGFETLLATLWDCVVQPVLRHLKYMSTPPSQDLPRITWCATGPLAFLPLHAAGRYDKPNSKIFDFVVSSYTPTISAMLRSNDRPSGPFRGILAVGQANTAGYTALPGTVAELGAISGQVGKLPYTQLDGDQATIEAIISGMETHDWVHMACHGSQDVTDPAKSAFHVHDGTLDLASITRRSVNHSGLAFLSACQTATGDETLPEESVHLAAGMLVAGYRSVIATMWSIQDEDAPLIADRVYQHLLQGGVPDVRRAPLALHEAVGCLRKQVGEKEFSRWVPYVHFGF